MPQPNTVQNPFLLMLSPETVLQAVERSAPLTSLRRRLCRPLDRGMPGSESPEVQGVDATSGPEAHGESLADDQAPPATPLV